MIAAIVYSNRPGQFNKFKEHPFHQKMKIIQISDAKNISEAYQRIPEYKEELKGYDKIVLTHDDVFFKSDLVDSEPLIDGLLLHSEKDTLIGLAGSKRFDARICIYWWNYLGSLTGTVDHAKYNKDGSLKRWSNSYGPFDHVVNIGEKYLWYSKAKVIDGLFILAKKDYLVNRNPFRNSRGNHFYDIRASLNTPRVLVMDFRVEHFGLGDSMQSNDYVQEGKRLLVDSKSGVFPEHYNI